MKKLISMILVAILMLGCNTFVFAAESSTQDNEYEAAVAKIMSTYRTDPEAAKKALADLDTVLLEEPRIEEHSVNNDGMRGINPTDYVLSVYSFKRGGSSIHYLQWMVESKRDEWFSGPLDYVSIEWDTGYASYYLSNGDNTHSTVQGRNTGIVLFNVQDGDLKKGEYSYGTVQVKPIKSGWLEFGSKYVHTYTELVASGTASYSFAPSASISASGDFSLGLSSTYGFTVSVTGNTSKWQIWSDNAVKL